MPKGTVIPGGSRIDGGLMKRIDGSKLGDAKGHVIPIQTGHVTPPMARRTNTPEPEKLTPEQAVERKVYIRIIRKLVPQFPINKLDKQELRSLVKYFEEEVSFLIQEEILERYKKISP